METGPYGEYKPGKELNLNFKIPRKTPEEPVQEIAPVYPVAPVVPPQFPVATYAIQATQNLILQNIQKREYERPKTYQNHILRETIPDCFDESLPRDLTSLFQPLYCKLCSAQLSSNVVAKLHYKSKNHEKKIRKFLTEYSERTGEPLHKRARLSAPGKSDTEDNSNPMYFFCDVCDLPLTGKLHAESHYMGKNHRKATLGLKAPSGKGHFDANGKWVREGKKPASDGFGDAFRVEIGPQMPTGFRCDICNVTTTCHEQLEAHYMGQKHRKKLKQLSPEVQSEIIASPESFIIPDVSKVDCSVYRTPSGQYYCQICNSSNNSEMQFRQHLQSKNHVKKMTQQKK